MAGRHRAPSATSGGIRRHPGRITAAAVVVALAGAGCIGVAVHGQQHAPQPASISSGPLHDGAAGAPKAVGPVMKASLPRVLAIPAIGVRSTLVRLGLAADGAMEVPVMGPHYDQAGWYRYSPPPGSLGPAVIAGHVDSAAQGPSVFFRLGRLKAKDTVLVTRDDGSVAVFAVDSVKRYPKSTFPAKLVYGNTNNAALRLITCGGTFDRQARSYLDNIVVFASLVRSTP
ncbi:MAG: class F sortase [Pseudonocardiales bacterium]